MKFQGLAWVLVLATLSDSEAATTCRQTIKKFTQAASSQIQKFESESWEGSFSVVLDVSMLRRRRITPEQLMKEYDVSIRSELGESFLVSGKPQAIRKFANSRFVRSVYQSYIPQSIPRKRRYEVFLRGYARINTPWAIRFIKNLGVENVHHRHPLTILSIVASKGVVRNLEQQRWVSEVRLVPEFKRSTF